MRRRDFIVAASAAVRATAEPGRQFVKSICSVIFPDAMPVAERFRQAKSAGFDAIELRFGDEIGGDTPADSVRRIGDAAEKAGVKVASLWISNAISATPLNSADAGKRARGVELVRQAIDFASWLNCGALLIVPGRLGTGGKLTAGYEDTWQRVTAELRKLIPYAAERKVIITPENVWNKFLVSPLEMRTFVDQFSSSWLQAHFDVGNVMQFGYPQDWIHVLGPRIKRVHLKDYKLSTRAEQGHFVDLLEGDVDWRAVMSAFVEAGYRGTLSPEYGYSAADPDRISKISQSLDKILAMA
jgi:hexulose-6-phosphate isomerase